ncbi:MAG TPA: DegV family protein [Candidatus Limnocylindrales bacterium]|nr:DegV family protein [Candidatus Limnocylindrales bacterium]
MASVAIVTDTSSDLLPDDAEKAGIRLVPLSVSFGDQTFQAVTELSNEEFYDRLTAPGAPLPKTAAPNPQQFEAAYRDALEHGADSVVCVTISKELSATYGSAVQGAAAFGPGQVEVVDSRTVTHALAMLATDAAALARSGASQAEVVARVRDLVPRSHILFAVDTLEYLQRGGRIGRASALLGSVLSIKPILRVEDGVVATADRRRTAAKARARLLELACEHPIEQATVVHTVTPGIEAFRDELAAAAGLAPEAIGIGLVGPVAGTHVGPGLYGVSLITTG